MNILSPVLGDGTLALLLSTLILILLSYVLGRIARLVLSRIAERLAKKTRSTLDDLVVGVLARYAVLLITVMGVYWVLGQLQPFFEDTPLVMKNVAVWFVEGMYIIAVLLVCYVLARVVDAVVGWYLKEVASRTQTHLDDELAPLVRRVLNILIYAGGVIIILDHFKQDISTLVVSLGVGSLAIALAAQETLANMIAGFVLMIDRPFRVGDRIMLPDGTIGNVAEIGIRSTKVISDYHVMVITPNAEIVKSQIRNYSYPNDVVRFEVAFGVAYGTDLTRMREVVLESVNRESDIVEPDSSEIRIVEMGDSSVNATLLCKIQNPNNIPRRKSDLLLLIYDTLYAHNIEIPFPQRVLHIAPSSQDLLRGRTRGKDE
jgi:small-conductance mechanosensitive channel